ncbi:hypothetical protein ACN9MH_05130 [Paenibacillus silvae]|uniref:hypothetical protein n=1 Tax=Paenibacillus TaxID=44249 RepID=UPI001C119F95|nr:hypothetical protein [Paenibacillus barcinonensis]MBU5353372.1 hypothetical protein [Paenibacillus barcinonensis]
MPKSIYFKQKEELLPEELMAYTLAKLGSYEWNRTEMYNPNRIYEHPAGFYFRFHNADQVYEQLKPCIEQYKGSLKWTIHVSPTSKNKNYVIEPADVYHAKQTEIYQANLELEEVLQASYKEICELAIQDIPLLCNHVEQWFELEHKKTVSTHDSELMSRRE